MNSVIYNTNDSFDFNKLSLNPPMVTNGGNYFIKYVMDGGNLYIQPPECKTKNGISKSSKHPSCDLMFSQENIQLIKWMEDLETRSCQLIYENREKWFESEMDLSDIENYFASPLKSYKSGKFYLARANLPNRLGKINLKIYNENNEQVSLDSIVENTNVFAVLEVLGIKCSARSFQIEMEIKQMMTLEPVNLFENCVIDNQRAGIMHSSNRVVTSNIPTPSPSRLDLEENSNQEIQQTEKAEEIQQTEKAEEIQQTEETEEKEDNQEMEQNEMKENDYPTLETPALEEKHLEESEKEESIVLEKEDNEENVVKEEPVEEVSVEITNENEPIDLQDLEFTVDLDKLSNDETISIKPHNDIYYERYREARKRARIAKNMALQAFLEAKEIKNKYQLDDIDSDDEEFLANEIEELEKEQPDVL